MGEFTPSSANDLEEATEARLGMRCEAKKKMQGVRMSVGCILLYLRGDHREQQNLSRSAHQSDSRGARESIFT